MEITPEIVKSRFHYKNGNLIWREGYQCAGRVAGWIASRRNRRYRDVRLYGKCYQVHRLVWIYFNAVVPQGLEIDHINHDTLDNRIENLRLVTRLENMRNKSPYQGRLPEDVGVCCRGKNKHWRAYIRVDGKMLHLGTYKTKQEARNARKDAEKVHGFHPNHGEHNLHEKL